MNARLFAVARVSVEKRIAPVTQAVEKSGVGVVDAVHGRFEVASRSLAAAVQAVIVAVYSLTIRSETR